MYSSSSSAASTSRRYGRGASVVSEVFARAPTSDPFLFDDSDHDHTSPVKASDPKKTKKVSCDLCKHYPLHMTALWSNAYSLHSATSVF